METESHSPSASMHPVGTPQWLAGTREEILEPDLPIIDPHHHLWGPPRGHYLRDDLLADVCSGHNVVATVFAECSERYRTKGPSDFLPVGETEYVAELAETPIDGPGAGIAFCAGIMGYADLCTGARVRDILEAHIDAGRGRFRGIRQSSVWDPSGQVRTTSRTPPPRLLYEPSLREGFAELAPLGLSFDAWLYHHQLSDLADLAKAFPDTTIVLDHVGGVVGIGPYVGRRDEVFHEWSQGIHRLAQYENVVVKLGGLGMPLCGFGFHQRPRAPSSQELADAWRPYLITCIEQFGPARAMFESNFPVDKASCSYPVLWNAFKRIAQDFSASEKADLFHRTAARVYRLELPDAPAPEPPGSGWPAPEA